MKLSEYVKKNYKTQAEAAKANGMSAQYLGQLIKNDRHVWSNGEFYIQPKKRKFK